MNPLLWGLLAVCLDLIAVAWIFNAILHAGGAR